jgi:hypothetical protein
MERSHSDRVIEMLKGVLLNPAQPYPEDETPSVLQPNYEISYRPEKGTCPVVDTPLWYLLNDAQREQLARRRDLSRRLLFAQTNYRPFGLQNKASPPPPERRHQKHPRISLPVGAPESRASDPIAGGTSFSPKTELPWGRFFSCSDRRRTDARR